MGRAFILFFLFSSPALGGACQEHPLIRCAETCKVKCQNLEIRPRVNDSGLLRVSYKDCFDQCESFCNKPQAKLVRELKNRNRPLAEFVLEDRKENDCEVENEAPTIWKSLLSKIITLLFSLLGWTEKNHPSASNQDVPLNNPPAAEGTPTSATKVDRPEKMPESSPAKPVMQSLVPTYVSPEPSKNLDASSKKRQLAADSPALTESTFRKSDTPPPDAPKKPQPAESLPASGAKSPNP